MEKVGILEQNQDFVRKKIGEEKGCLIHKPECQLVSQSADSCSTL